MIMISVMFIIQGPLVLLRGFDVTMIKICSTHVCNLGLVYTANGGALSLGLTLSHRPKLKSTILPRHATTLNPRSNPKP